ncbi:hypothetical protein MSG28_015646 [Choristoneura fumiferana]|uniref:Uncharacterized protein n=1 Tax=Choristoneura fumiferana TaxID=7141 RepID=A0ACC0KBR0_CHOFU|nr:hypothetical protein MSG28_015646 [Choristoneura fumiferana]
MGAKLRALENNFQEVRCERVFESMRLCCIKFKPQSLVCSGYDLEPRQFAPDTEKLDKSKEGHEA